VASNARQLKTAAAAVKQKAKLAALMEVNKRLKLENAQLKAELDRYLDQWETIDGPALSLVVHLAGSESGTAGAIAKATDTNIQIVETSLNYLQKLHYVQANGNRKKPVYSLLPKGVRYLRERGLRT